MRVKVKQLHLMQSYRKPFISNTTTYFSQNDFLIILRDFLLHLQALLKPYRSRLSFSIFAYAI